MFVKRSLESRRSFLRYLWIFFGVSLDFCKSPIQLPWAFVRDFHEIALNLRLHLIFAWSLLDVHSAFCMSNVFCLLLASLDFRWMFDGCSLDPVPILTYMCGPSVPSSLCISISHTIPRRPASRARDDTAAVVLWLFSSLRFQVFVPVSYPTEGYVHLQKPALKHHPKTCVHI